MKERLRALPLRDIALLALAVGVLVTFDSLRAGTESNSAQRLDSYSSYDAATGGYRAWYELLQREGVAVGRFERQPAFLVSELRTLIWAEPLPFDQRQTQNSGSDVASLEAWVKAGGRFLYIGHDEAAAKAGTLGLPRTQAGLGTPNALRVAASLRKAGVLKLWLTDVLRWKVTSKRKLTPLVWDAAGPLAVTYPYGRGTVVAVLDEAAFTNEGIVHADNARLAFALAGSSGRVDFDEAAHGYLVPAHWWEIVPRRFLIALLVALGAIAVAFIGAAIRLGPPIVPAERDDAGSAEFLDSLAALFERGHAVRRSLDDLERTTLRFVTDALGLRADAPLQDVEVRIERADLRADLRGIVAAGMTPNADARTLVRVAAAAQRLRKEYGSDVQRRR